ncbi:hypothetical protein, conserved [Leishmania tarentolae]|uniref:Uncharacterized protein n=1 Tax=Leishmania tarentolae TaxID=5689 RepID=A0A640KHA9_LEITA|nr:hypothetical protein, conserved [Leishmania tarentolae]
MAFHFRIFLFWFLRVCVCGGGGVSLSRRVDLRSSPFHHAAYVRCIPPFALRVKHSDVGKIKHRTQAYPSPSFFHVCVCAGQLSIAWNAQASTYISVTAPCLSGTFYPSFSDTHSLHCSSRFTPCFLFSLVVTRRVRHGHDVCLIANTHPHASATACSEFKVRPFFVHFTTMDADELRQLAINVSSDDIAVVRDATKRLQQLLMPQEIVAMLKDSSATHALRVLVEEMEMVGSADIFHLIGRVLECVLTQSSKENKVVLFAPTSQFLVEFIVRCAASADTAVASSMSKTLYRLIAVAGDSVEAAAFLGPCLNTHFHSEKVLRLFDCDAIESEENKVVCTFLDNWTSLLPFMFEATLDAFENDPLLQANYIVASGVACRTVAVPSTLRQRTMDVLCTNDDPLCFAYVCRFWSIMLLRHEVNGQQDAAACVSAVMPAVEGSERDETVTEAIFDLLGSAASTQAGWDAVTGKLPCKSLQVRLSSTSPSLRLSTLNLILSLLTSPHMNVSFFTKDLLLDAWQTRTSPDDMVRLALWRVVNAALLQESLNRMLCAMCASFLSSGAHEENVAVRSLKLTAAENFLRHSTLPENIKVRLSQVVKLGLYPAGSSGVSLMTKD